MSILVANLKNLENTSLLKKIIDALLEIAEALAYEDYRDSAFDKYLGTDPSKSHQVGR